MNSVVVAMLIVFISATMSLAQVSPTNDMTKSIDAKPMKLIEKVVGSVEKIHQPSNAKGDFGTLTFVAADGTKLELDLIAKSKVFNAKSVMINFGDIKVGDDLTVLYVKTIKGKNDVITITKVH